MQLGVEGKLWGVEKEDVERDSWLCEEGGGCMDMHVLSHQECKSRWGLPTCSCLYACKRTLNEVTASFERLST